MKKLLTLICTLLYISTAAQRIYIVNYQGQHIIKVTVVKSEIQADLKVYEVTTDTKAKGNKGRWYLSDNPSGAVKICWVETESEAQLKIYLVGSESQAGWRNESKKYLLKIN